MKGQVLCLCFLHPLTLCLNTHATNWWKMLWKADFNVWPLMNCSPAVGLQSSWTQFVSAVFCLLSFQACGVGCFLGPRAQALPPSCPLHELLLSKEGNHGHPALHEKLLGSLQPCPLLQKLCFSCLFTHSSSSASSSFSNFGVGNL